MKEHISAYIKELNALYQTGLTIEHYRRIIAILIETDKIMKQIDNN